MTLTTTGHARAAGGSRVPGRPGRRGRPARRREYTYAALLLPSFALILLVNIYPLIYAVKAAIHNGSLLSPGANVGLQNFGSVLTTFAFWQAARFTVLFAVVAVIGSWVVGLALALVLRIRFPGRAFFRVALLLPWVVPVVVTSTSWRSLVGTQTGPAATLAQHLGFGNVLFLGTPTMAAATLFVFKIWISYPFMMLTMGAALEGVDTSLYEAAQLDGASRLQRLRRITLPLIARPTYISWILVSIFTINDFPTVWLLTGGGPVSSTQTLIVYAYNLAFYEFQPGLGLAVAFLMTALMAGVSTVLFVMVRRSFART